MTAGPQSAKPRQRLLYFTAGFLRQPRLRQILQAAGYDLAFGPWARWQKGDAVVVWGKSPHAHRGEAFAAQHDLPLVRLEDSFVRSVGLGRAWAAPLGLMIDPVGVHFDAAAPSQLEQILARHPLDETPLLARAKAGLDRLQRLDISKYNLHDPSLAPPEAGYVLVIDQTVGDASIVHSGADAARFTQMLDAARDENPHARILIKTHPETALGHRAGHFGAKDCDERVQITRAPLSPWALLEGAIAVYTVSSQMGLEAIFAGHRPHVFGTPFYAGWGLTHDRQPPPSRRGRTLSRVQMFAASHLLAPIWYDPYRRTLCRFEDVMHLLEADLQARRTDAAGYVAVGMRAWKRGRLQAVFGAQKPVIFRPSYASAAKMAQKRGAKLMVWGAAPVPDDAAVLRIEDGFLRSNGLGAALVPPISLVVDDMGLYFDPARPSRFEHFMMQPLPDDARMRSAELLHNLRAARLTKYNLGGELPDMTAGAGRLRLLVPGQVGDDASVLLGAGRDGQVLGNLDALIAARAAYPDAYIIYKPHPDVEAGLRAGHLSPQEMAGLADVVAHRADAAALLDHVDQVFTLTSTYGFEALLRGLRVSCLGAPFYAGWGLTQDLGPIPQRRTQHLRSLDQRLLAKPDLLHLVHAALIAYPRYFDPVTRTACPPEVALWRLAQAGGRPLPQSAHLRLMAKLQGYFAGYAHWWR